MNRTALLVSAALAGLMNAVAPATAHALLPPNPADKCYGVAKANQNSCASVTGVHSCKGQAKVDNDPGDFVYLAPYDCLQYGGKTTPPVAAAPAADTQ